MPWFCSTLKNVGSLLHHSLQRLWTQSNSHNIEKKSSSCSSWLPLRQRAESERCVETQSCRMRSIFLPFNFASSPSLLASFKNMLLTKLTSNNHHIYNGIHFLFICWHMAFKMLHPFLSRMYNFRVNQAQSFVFYISRVHLCMETMPNEWWWII